MFKRKVLFFLALIIFLGAIALTVPGWGDVREVATGSYPTLNQYLEEYGEASLPNKYVEVTIDENLGCFASRDGDEDNKAEYYYIAWLDDSSFIAFKVGEEASKQLDAMADETWKYVDGEITPDQYNSEPYTFVARISDIDNEVARFYRSYVMECGIDESKYVVRYQDLIKADPDVLTVIVDKFLFHIIAAIVSLIVMLNVGSKLRRERKALVSFESSVQDYNPADKIKREPVVSVKQAVSRITFPVISNYYKKAKRGVLISLIIVILGIAVPADLYAYTEFYKPSGGASKVYDMDSNEDYQYLRKKSVAEITTEYYPVVVRSTGSSSADYIVFGQNALFIAEFDDAEYSKAIKEIQEKGKVILHGYCGEISDETAEYAIDYLNSYYEEDYSESDAGNLFGAYSLVIEDSYKGGGVTKSTVETVAIIAIFIVAFTLLGLLIQIAALRKFKKDLTYMSDTEYMGLESALASPQTYKVSEEIYCAERYIVALGGRRMIIPYSDILWIYHKINYQNGVENNNEIVILDKENGAYSLPSLKSGAESKQIIGRVLEIIKSKNPDTRIGYTQDNIKAAAGTSV